MLKLDPVYRGWPALPALTFLRPACSIEEAE